MTKYEWDSRLRKALKELPADERQRVFEYYDELFEDKMDGGAAEEEIINAFGEPEAAAKKILSDYRAYLDRDDVSAEKAEDKEEPNTLDLKSKTTRGFCTETDRGGAVKPDKTKSEEKPERKLPPAEDIFESEGAGEKKTEGRFGGVRKLKISVVGADVTVKRGDGCDVKTFDDNDSGFEVTTGGDTLYIKEKPTSFWKNITLGLFGGKGKRVTVELPSLESVTFDSMRCSCEIDGFALRRATLKTVNGDLSVINCDCEYLSLSTTGGDLTAKNGRCDSVSFSTAAGDISVNSVFGKSLTAVSMSGDIEAEDCRFEDRMLLKTVGGDVKASGVECGSFECKTVGGESDIILVGDAKDYTVSVHSVSGTISAPRGGNGPKRAAVSSVGGHIRLDIVN